MKNQTFTLPPDKRDFDIARVAGFLRDVLPGKPIKVEISESKKARSDDQNAALWGVAYPPLMEHMGLSGEDERQQLHREMCGAYFGWKDFDVHGFHFRRPKRTTTSDEAGKRNKLDTAAFSAFYAFVQRKGAEMGVYVPDPDSSRGAAGMAQVAHYQREAE